MLKCPKCEGVGLLIGTAVVECQACHGTGKMLGSTCLGCAGSGRAGAGLLSVGSLGGQQKSADSYGPKKLGS
jgi:hypothetical protein